MAAGLSAQERVIELLRTLHDARVDWDGRGGDDPVPLVLMPSMWHEGSYQELEHRLVDLRERRRLLWWHVCYRYRFGDTRVLSVPVHRVKRQTMTQVRYHLPPRTELIAAGPSQGSRHAMVRVYQWSATVQPPLVVSGIEALTASMYDGQVERIFLPDAVYRRKMGLELKAA